MHLKQNDVVRASNQGPGYESARISQPLSTRSINGRFEINLTAVIIS